MKSFKHQARQWHLWIALSIFIPVVIVIGSGLLLQVKKEFDWIQPPTAKQSLPQDLLNVGPFQVSLNDILQAVIGVDEANVQGWDDIDRLDVRPDRALAKVQTHSRYEIQVSTIDGSVLQVAYRRSDAIESIHDGSWFFEGAKLWLFLPAGILLLVMWLSGAVLLYHTLKAKFRINKR